MRNKAPHVLVCGLMKNFKNYGLGSRKTERVGPGRRTRPVLPGGPTCRAGPVLPMPTPMLPEIVLLYSSACFLYEYMRNNAKYGL